MPYVGRENITGEFIKLDAIPQAASNTFNLQRSGAAFAPGTTEQCIVSVNGVTQAPGDAFNISGSQIVFTSTLSANDVIDYILVMGSALSAGVPSDGSVSTAKIANGAVDLTSKVTGVLPVANGGAASIPIFQISSTASQSISHNTSTQLTFNTANIDTHSITDVANNKVTITAATAGYYMLHAKWTVDNTSPFRSLVAIVVNGTTKFVTEQAQYSQTQSTNQTNLTTGIINLVDGDDITVNVLHGYGSARNSLGSSNGPQYNFLQGFRITT